MLGDILKTFTGAARTFSDIAYRNRQSAFENKLALARQKLLEQEAATKRKGRRQGHDIFTQARDHLKRLRGYDLDDVYQKLNLGKGKDDLSRYRVGPTLREHLVPKSAFNQLAQNKLFNQTQSDNLNLLRRIRDKGSTATDRKELAEVLSRQRSENKALQDTLTRRAIERGERPGRARLTQRLLAAQSAANRNSDLFRKLAADSSTRRFSALQALEGGLNDRFDQFARIAGARDRVRTKNTDIRNETARSNVQRRRQTQDTNTALHNENAVRSATERQKAGRAVTDSYNDRLQSLANLAKAQAQSYYRY